MPGMPLTTLVAVVTPCTGKIIKKRPQRREFATK